MPRKVVPEGASLIRTFGPYTSVIQVGSHFHFAGIVPNLSDEGGLLHPASDDVAEQYRQVVANMQAALGASTLGIVGSLLGVGCASCGSVLLVSLFGFSTAAGFLAALPLGGMEFGLGSIAILTLSIAFMLKKLRSPLVCK